MLSQSTLEQIKNIQLRAGFLATNTLAGEYSSAFKGVGMEFEKVREYIPGDEVRSIDWNVTARTGTPYVKVYREEREMTLMLLVDVSPSLKFGTDNRMKQQIATELAGLLSFLAIKNNDRVGLVVFSDHVEAFIPPAKGKHHVWHIIRSVFTHESQGKQTNIAEGLSFFLNVCKRKSLCFLISDFWADGFQSALKLAAKRHALTCIRVLDQGEFALPQAGLLSLIDAETKETLLVNSQDPEFREEYAKFFKQQENGLTSWFRQNRIDHFQVTPAEGVVPPLIKFLRTREKRWRL